ncbi:MAG: hypothetical protein EOP45_19690 [Sphingobacteriaceae bacterium]|nr:MAG: hypothetical protein EOP45_19690 [Sphingobacteriaceae bacterium]
MSNSPTLKLSELHYEAIGQRWKLIPRYIDYMLCNHLTSRKPCVIFDLDGCIRPDYPNHEHRATFPHVIETMEKLHNMGIEMFIITARPVSSKDTTLQYLSTSGIFSYMEDIYFLPTGEDRIEFKSRIRTFIREKYSIIMAVGDQKQDLCHNDVDEDEDCCMNILMENPWTFE